MQRADRFTPLLTFVNDSFPSYSSFDGRLRPFFALSYPVPTPPQADFLPEWQHYRKGRLDVCFVLTAVLVFFFLREFTMSYILSPIARRLLPDRRKSARPLKPPQHHSLNGSSHPQKAGQKSAESQANGSIDRAVTRFCEQGFSVIFYSVYWAFGMFIYVNSPMAPLHLENLWIGYPHDPLSAPVKFYYLTQLAAWLHQLVIIHLEARRKDHWQMFSHHIITISLITASYISNFTRIGCFVLVLMDWCDILLPLAKMFQYLEFSAARDVTFIVFLICWVLTRHLLFGLLTFSAYRDAPRLIPFRWSPARGLYLTKNVYAGFIALLLSLQALLVVWFGIIFRVAFMVAVGQGAGDVRSDDEGDDIADSVEVTDEAGRETRKDR